MSNYRIVCDIETFKTGDRTFVGNANEKREWKNLTKEEVIRIENAMAVYLEELYKLNEKRAKKELEDPVEIVDGSQVNYTVEAECIIYKDEQEWAAMTFRLPNQTVMTLTVLNFLFTKHLSSVGKKINSKMTVTR